MNPSVDIFGVTDRLVDDGKSRCRVSDREPGGGGINVARNLHRLGVDVLALFPAGGLNGDLLQQMLEQDGLPFQRFPVNGETRQSLAITEEATDRMFHFVFSGPQLQKAEWQQCLDTIKALQPTPDYLVLSGSLPGGVPADFFARISAAAARQGIRVVLDSSGPALTAPIQEAGVYLAKLNRGEFADLGYTGPVDYPLMLDAMEQMVSNGPTQALIVTLDADGALLATRDGERLHIRPPATSVLSHVGAGDSFVTVLVYQLQRGLSLADAFRYGVAAAAAKVNTPGNQLQDMDKVERFYQQILNGLL